MIHEPTGMHAKAISSDAARLLDLLASGEVVTFQTFDDAKHNRRGLTRVLHGSFAQHADTLAALNARGAGVYWMVNAGDGLGRRASSVRHVRALFVDLDGSPLEPVLAARLSPHVIVESSPGRWHAYWRVADCSRDDFTSLQKALAAHFNGDPKVCDLPRVLRLPGFDHHKGRPYPCRIKVLHPVAPYTVAELIEAFNLRAHSSTEVDAIPVALERRTLPKTIPEGQRNATLLSLAAGLVRKGHDLRAVAERLHRINVERCAPPLDVDEVSDIAGRAVRYGSDGFSTLPHALLDSPEWKGLPPAAHEVILVAIRRYNGVNNGNIALTWADFEGREGFAKKDTFYRHRRRAIESGILRRSSEGRNGQSGRKPDLFSIDPKWLRHPASPQKGDWPEALKGIPLNR